VLTFGHGRADRDRLAALLTGAGVEHIVDVRRFPGSRANPAAAAGQIEALATELGISYRHEPRFGGRRRLTAAEAATAPDTWWTVPAFRAYAGWTRGPQFRAALTELLETAAPRTTALMCSESLWWRCHRRLIADVLVCECAVAVGHLMHNGTIAEHRPCAGARIGPDGRLIWDGAAAP